MKLVIVTNSSIGTTSGISAEGRDKLTGYLEGRGWFVWHWMEDLWLVSTGGEVVLAGVLVRQLLPLLGMQVAILVQVVTKDSDYAINCPLPGTPWIDRHWLKQD